MRTDTLRLISILVIMILLAGCGGAPVTPAVNNTEQAKPSTIEVTSTAEEVSEDSTTTPDACSTEMIEAEVQKVHRHMREFDDASILASNLPIEELSEPVANLQRIRREAEDEQIPACLTTLKNHQLDHMNSVINTLIVFIGGADTGTLEKGILVAREQHDQYTLELARLLGLTVVPATVPVISTPAGTAAP